MMEILERGDVVMNLIGLILIAALSGGIVAVSLRLRAIHIDNRKRIEPAGYCSRLVDLSERGCNSANPFA